MLSQLNLDENSNNLTTQEQNQELVQSQMQNDRGNTQRQLMSNPAIKSTDEYVLSTFPRNTKVIRVLIYAYFPRIKQFTFLRLLSKSDVELVSYVQTHSDVPDLRIQLANKKFPQNFDLRSLWKFCRNPVFVFHYSYGDLDKSTKQGHNKFRQIERFRRETFLHNLQQIVAQNSQERINKFEKTYVYFEIGFFDNFPFKNDNWLNMGTENNIEFQVIELILQFKSLSTYDKWENYANLLAKSTIIKSKQQDVLCFYFNEYRHEKLMRESQLQFRCQYLKISGWCLIHQDYFKYLDNLRELQIGNKAFFFYESFKSFSHFPQKLRKISYTGDKDLQLIQNVKQIGVPQNLFKIIMDCLCYKNLKELEINHLDLPIVVDHLKELTKFRTSCSQNK
eukprot:403353339